ncbi:MAG: family transcriptional regulator [Microvirga sp.]|jgi:hypothetical protein|nr:family transcriptional regulator [Microvirga sp.]
MITPAQSRAARAFLKLTQWHVASAAEVALRTLIDFEGERRKPMTNNLVAIQKVLEAEGVEFTTDGGVRPRPRP